MQMADKRTGGVMKVKAGEPTTADIEREVKKAISGDTAAFEKLYELYADKIFKYIYYKISNIAEAEDLTSQVFLKAWEKIGNYEIRKSPFSSWLFRIAHNMVVDLYRERGKYPQDDDESGLLTLPENHTPETALMNRVENEDLRKALWKLTSEQRDVIVLRFIEGLSAAEVAAVMDKNEGAIRALQRRGLASLSGIYTVTGKKRK